MSDDHSIIAGHDRVEAARLIGMKEVPVRRLSHLSRDEIRAYILADNKLAENAGWDRELLATEMQDLIDFDIEILGFSTTEIDLVLDGEVHGERAADPHLDAPESISEGPASTRVGDIWQ